MMRIATLVRQESDNISDVRLPAHLLAALMGLSGGSVVRADGQGGGIRLISKFRAAWLLHLASVSN